MKDRVLYLILGILVGAVVTALVFTILMKNNVKGGRPNDMREMPENMGNFVMSENMVRPEMRNREMNQDGSNNPPEEVTE